MDIIIFFTSMGGVGASPIIIATILDRFDMRRGRSYLANRGERIQRWLGA